MVSIKTREHSLIAETKKLLSDARTHLVELKGKKEEEAIVERLVCERLADNLPEVLAFWEEQE